MKKFRHTTKRSGAGYVKVHGMNKDLIWHVLYDDDIELIRDILLQVCSLSLSLSVSWQVLYLTPLPTLTHAH